MRQELGGLQNSIRERNKKVGAMEQKVEAKVDKKIEKLEEKLERKINEKIEKLGGDGGVAQIAGLDKMRQLRGEIEKMQKQMVENVIVTAGREDLVHEKRVRRLEAWLTELHLSVGAMPRFTTMARKDGSKSGITLMTFQSVQDKKAFTENFKKNKPEWTTKKGRNISWRHQKTKRRKRRTRC